MFVLECYSALFIWFLQEFFGEQNKENVLTSEMAIEDDSTDNRSNDLRAIYDVRNYVIVQELGSFLLLNFKRDLSHLIGWNRFDKKD